jgi:hypothetical protein
MEKGADLLGPRFFYQVRSFFYWVRGFSNGKTGSSAIRLAVPGEKRALPEIEAGPERARIFRGSPAPR